jgi:hypothetical protein
VVLKGSGDRIVLPVIDGIEELSGIEIIEQQTFGFEFEFGGYRSRQRWGEVAWPVLAALRKVVPTRSRPGGRRTEFDRWKIVKDRSCGWEVNTRVLSGLHGIREVVAGLRVLEEIAPQLKVGHSPKTSTHVHLGWSLDLAAMSRLVEIVAYFEPALVRLVEPHRPDSRYCQSIAADLHAFRANKALRDWREFYVSYRRQRDRTISLKPLIRRFGTVEVRLHHGTFDLSELIPWLALWMSILGAADDGRALPVEPNWEPASSRDARKRQDISALCRFVSANDALEARLNATCEKYRRDWADRKVSVPRKPVRVSPEPVRPSISKRRPARENLQQLVDLLSARPDAFVDVTWRELLER